MPAPAKHFLVIGATAMLAMYRTGVEYHFYHALGLLALGLAAQRLRCALTLAC